MTHTVEMGVKITAGVEIEAGVVFAKAKTHLGVELHVNYSKSHTFTVSHPVPPKHISEVQMGGLRKVVSGEYTRVYDDCARFFKKVMIKAPWMEGAIGRIYPIKK